jgi:hypothetical protein
MTTLTAQGHLVVTRQRNGTSVTVSSIKVTYQGGTSGSEVPTGTWSTAIPSVSEGEYLWTRTVTTYSDGKSSTAYSSAYQGTNGLAGMIARVTEWASGFEYHNDEALTSGTRNLDFCTVTTSATSFKMYKCLKTHTSSSDILPTNTEYWQEMNSMTPIYTPMIIAAGALFRFTQTNQILVMESDGETVAAGMGGGDYPFWAGSATPSMATFRVGKDGSARMKGTLQLSTSYSGNFSDVNLFWIPQTTTELNISMGYENEDVGKVCRLYNSNAIGGKNVIVHLQTWGYRKYTDSNGSVTEETNTTYGTVTAVIQPQEAVELTCYSLPPSAYPLNGVTYDLVCKWTITNRFGTDNWKNDDGLGINGRFARILAIGRVVGTDSGATISGNYFDGRSLTNIWSVTRVDTGKYHVYFGGTNLPDGYKVMVSGYGWATNGGGPIKPTLYTENQAYFEVATSDDSTLNDGDFDFIILAPSWEHSM